MLLNYGVEKTLESPLDCKEIQPVHPKGDQSWVFIGRTDVEAETPILWPPHAKSWLTGKSPDAWRDWGQEEKGNNRGWDGWMASPTWWTWVWINSRSWWWTGRPGVLRFMGWQRVRHDWVTELNWILTVSIIWEFSENWLFLHNKFLWLFGHNDGELGGRKGRKRKEDGKAKEMGKEGKKEKKKEESEKEKESKRNLLSKAHFNYVSNKVPNHF